MTDNEIIKALECCLAKENCEEISCENCPYDLNRVYECKETMLQNAIDLINRQKAEIEKLNIELKAMRGSANFYKAEVERLRTQQSELISEYKNISIDAIKKFILKFKDRVVNKYQYIDVRIFNELDNLAKEMYDKT